MKKIFIIIFLLQWGVFIFAQDFSKLIKNPAYNQAPKLAYGTSKDFYPISPSAASLGVFGQIPVSAFTGIPEIAIPLHIVKYKDLAVPISINYHTGLVKPDLLPGPVGLGWALQAGGSVSRIINGSVDIGPKPVEILTEGPYPLSASGWDSQDVMDSMKAGANYYLPTQDPDTYIFNINGSTGKFCANHTGEFHIISDNGDFFFVTLNKTIQNNIEWLDGFTIKDTKGNTYEFGGTGATETTQPGFNSFTYDSTLSSSAYILPTTWHLKKITSPNGYSITFNYYGNSVTFKSRFTDYTIMNGENSPVSSKYMDNEKTNIINGLYIKEIIFMNYKLVFEYSPAVQLSYPASSSSNYDNFVWNKLPASNPPIPISMPEKLNRINIYDGSNKLFYFDFIYTADNTKRLKLLSVKKRSDAVVSESYNFEYNSTSLPPYLSGETDHYGFYNGNSFFNSDIQQKINNCISTFATASGQQSVNSLITAINSLKQPNANLMAAEILQKITTVTGGYTLYTFESHDYGCEHQIWPNSIQQNPDGSLLAGGVRIKEITQYDKSGVILEKTLYHYKKNYITGGNLSSGVLAYTPKYADYFYAKNIFKGSTLEAQNKSVFFITSNPLYPLSAVHGSHITYSEVTEEKPGNGYTVTVFKNYDNGYSDRPPLAYSATLVASPSSTYDNPTGVVAFWRQDEGISLGLERGKVISERIYDKTKNLFKVVNYEFNKDETRNIRYYKLEPTCVNSTGRWSYRMSAGLRYTYFPYLSKKTETIYPGGISNSQEYTYDENYRLLRTEKTFDSNGNSYQKSYLYPFDNPSDPTYQKMINLNMHGFNTELSQFRNGALLEKKVYTYADFLTYNIQLSEIEKKVGNGPLKREVAYTKFDDFGNPVEEKHENGMNRCIIWSTAGDNIIAIIENATFNEVQNALGYPPVNGMNITAIDNLRNSTNLKNAMITTFTYYPLGYVKTKKDPRGIVTTYTYDPLFRPQGEYDNQGNIIKYIEYKIN
ncbi:hypothetical protein [Proteiniphilum saccharofermentans]|uniref:hypothetical protein n=1 Tax=Proteiniphilum saccharofermentans TaxID=1642647 RepID=UPI0028A89DA4|nr:hypothetical protein [Proteiniphilum saccharofermentans]